MKPITQKAIFTALTIIFVISIVACASVPKEIPFELSAKELNQRAQECTSSGNYAGAEVYYNTLIQRFGMDISVLIPAEFELAHVYIKQKKYEKAKPILERVLSYYEVDSTNLPRQYKKLAQIDLDKIPQNDDKDSQSED